MDRELRVLVRARRRFVLGALTADAGDVVLVRVADLRALQRAGLAELVRDPRREVDPMAVLRRS